jgi:hypothetical protein
LRIRLCLDVAIATFTKKFGVGSASTASHR